MAPRSLPVINSSHLPNHKTGLQYLNIAANCLATSKGAPQDWEKSQKGGWGARGSFTSKGYVFVAWCSPVKLWPQNCCLRLSWWGKSIPQSLPAADTESLFTFRFLKLLPGSGWGQTPRWCIGEHVWEFLSHLKHIPEKQESTLQKLSDETQMIL